MTDRQIIEAAYRRVFLNFEHIVVVCATQHHVRAMVGLMKEHLEKVEGSVGCGPVVPFYPPQANVVRFYPPQEKKQAVCDFVTVDELRTKMMGTRPDGVYLRTEVSQEDWLDILTRCPGGVIRLSEED